MSDRSHAHVTIYAISDPQNALHVWDVLRENDFDVEYAGAGLDDTTAQVGLRLGLEYVHNEMVTGSIGQVAADLAALGATFEASQDHSCGGGSADLYRHTPDLGLHAAASLDSEAVVGAATLARIMAETTDRDGLVRALAQRTGTAWAMALDAARDAVEPDHDFSDDFYAAGPVSLPLPLCTTCGSTERSTCPGH